MNDLLISLLVFAVIFGGALLGAVVRPWLSEVHLQPDSRDVVKMATGLIGTLAALVLGLLIASAKGSFDQRSQGADRKSTRLNSSHANISYAVFCLKKKKNDFHEPLSH